MYVVSRFLSFLQSRINQWLALSMVKDQISALVVLFQRLIVSHSLVHVFVQGITHIIPLDSIDAIGPQPYTFGFADMSM